jgi:hypothetical protein
VRSDRIGVYLHGPDDLAAAVRAELAGRGGAGVAVASGVLIAAAMDLAGCEAVVGVDAAPWPVRDDRHRRARATLEGAGLPYYAVESWHLLPRWTEALAAAVEQGRADTDTHVLFTAPGPTTDVHPDTVVFLREVAEAVTERLGGLTRRSIGWSEGLAKPDAHAALLALVEAHQRTDIVHCPVGPRPDTAPVHAAASTLGVQVIDAVASPSAHVAALADVVQTVLAHER